MIRRQTVLLLTTLLITGWLPARARAEERRFAIIVGHNEGGSRDERPLKYAEQDAREIRAVLTTLGGFAEKQVALLLGEDAEAIRQAFRKLSERMKAGTVKTGTAGTPEQALFVFYFSGHAGVDGLHLGQSLLRGQELRDLIDGVPTTVKVAIVDACHAGALVYLKGGNPTRTFPISVPEPERLKGTAFIMSCGINEESQESDEFRHSIFTYWLLAALRGAADFSRDGWVTLPEAWDYVKRGTLLTTTRTKIAQRPIWDVNVRGQDSIKLTDLSRSRNKRAIVEFPAWGDYWIFRDDGVLVAEVHAELPGRRIALDAGHYFIRRRQKGDHLLERRISLRSGNRFTLALEEMEPVPYLRLANKGRSESNWFRHGPQVLVHYHGESLGGLGPLLGGGFAWPMLFGKLWFSPRVMAGGSSLNKSSLTIDMYEVELDLLLGYGFDLGPVVLQPRLVAGTFLGHQKIDHQLSGVEEQTTLGAQFGGGLSLLVIPFDNRLHLEFGLEAAAYLYRHGLNGGAQEEWKIVPTFRLLVGLGYVL